MKHEAANAVAPTARSTDQRIYQLKVTLQDVYPPIWRRFQVPAGYSLQELHEVLQITMGWENSHPYQFVVGAIRYGEAGLELDEPPTRWAHRTKLRTAAPRLGTRLLYEYDFGDGWWHEVVVEGLVLPEEGV